MREHKIRGRLTLPGAAHFEFVRKALLARRGEIPGVEFSDVYWLRPWHVEEGQTLFVRIEEPTGAYTIHDGHDEYVKGRCAILPEANPEKLSYENVSYEKILAKADIYRALSDYGIGHGPQFQVLGHATAQARGGEAGGLSPLLIDGVFQTVTHLDFAAQKEGQHVPFHLERAVFFGELPLKCFVQANARGGLYDMKLYDRKRNVLAAFTGFKKKALSENPAKPESLHHYTTKWFAEAPIPRKAPSTRVVCISEGEIPADLPASFLFVEQGAESKRENHTHYRTPFPDKQAWKQTFSSIIEDHGEIGTVLFLVNNPKDRILPEDLNTEIHCLAIVQGLILSKPKSETPFLVCVRTGVPLHQCLVGFARTLAREYPKIPMHVVVTDSGEQIQEEIENAPPPMRLVRHRGGKREVLRVAPVSVPGTPPPAPRFREDGVTVIAGGAGGLGRIFAGQIPAGHIALLGRREENPEIRTFLDAFSGRASYRSLDVTDAAQVVSTLSEIRREHGPVTGVIHAAGVIEDDYILRKDTDSFRRVLATKVLGCVHLDEATAADPLDFFIAFSSIASLMPNQGQADYATGNGFLDTFMEYRRSRADRRGESLAVNWPLWKNGGMQVLPEEVRHLEEVFGMKPLETEAGTGLFRQILSPARPFAELSQIVLIDGDKRKTDRHLHAGGVSADPEELRRELQYLVRGLAASVLKRILTDDEERQSFPELGLDSEGLIAFCDALNRRTGLDLKPTALFTHNTVESLAGHVLKSPFAERFRQTLEERRAEPLSLIDLSASEPEKGLFRKTLSTREFFMQGHIRDGMYVLPGACFVEMALQAGREKFGDVLLKNNLFLQRLTSYGEETEMRLAVNPDGAYEIRNRNILCAQGYMAKVVKTPPPPSPANIPSFIEKHAQKRTHREIVRQMISEGVAVSPEFVAAQEI